MKITAIIPTLNPTDKLLAVVDQLCRHGFSQIIIVNDGSNAHCQPIFCKLQKNPCCIVLMHQHNEGKGQALKTAFRYYLSQPIGQQLGVITLDDDGQHDIKSIVACAQVLENNVEALILGVRDFSTADMPPKSRYGNKLTSAVFAFFCGLHISDTQTGLRGIPNRWLARLAEASGDRFEYETNMLLAAKQHHIPIQEVPIQTIYIEANKSTHFRPLADSFRIYHQLLRFVTSSVLSFVVDIVLFWFICQLPLGTTIVRVFWATLTARAASSVVNFLTNRHMVFHENGVLLHSIARYYLLCGGQALASLLLVGGLGTLCATQCLVPLKILIDGSLFFVSFQIQKNWVFRCALQEAQKV